MEEVIAPLFLSSSTLYAYNFSVIYCGELPLGHLSGFDPDAVPAMTTYNSTFQFTCQPGFNLTYNSSDGDNSVRCMANGKWDLRDLRCIGRCCADILLIVYTMPVWVRTAMP